ncbi:Uncharacterised protein [Mycobacterium tuberculosis]|nr:Uncharacterised protein [Mycobacterium tuberculosis]
MASCTPPTIRYAHGSTPPVSIPASCMRRRSITASMRAMIRSESAITLLLLAMLGIKVVCVNRIITAVVRSFLSTK